MKKITSFIFCIILILSITACGNNKKEPEVTSSESETVQLPNPFRECQSLEEASELAGFEISVPDTVGEYSQRIIRAMSNEMIEVLYRIPDGAGQITIRKAPGSNDISGDYNQYKEINETSVGELQVTMKGDNEKISIATWAVKDYSFSVSSTDGLDSSAMEKLISSIN